MRTVSNRFQEERAKHVIPETVVVYPPRRCTGDTAGWREISVPGAGAAGLLLFCRVLGDTLGDDI